VPQDAHFCGDHESCRIALFPANHDIRPIQTSASACLVMKGPGVRVPPSASQSPCILAGFGLHDGSLSGSMRRIGQCDASEGARSCALGLDRRRAWVRANGQPRSSGSRGEASRIRLLDLGQAARLAPGSTGPTGAASCAARVGSIPPPLAVALRRPASSACAELARRRCESGSGCTPRLVRTRNSAVAAVAGGYRPFDDHWEPVADAGRSCPPLHGTALSVAGR
jgi:hypothetical protein